MTELVSAAAELTPRWLDGVLRSVIGDASVTAIETTRVGAGQLGECHRVSLTYDGAAPGAPASVLVKLPSRDPQSQAMAVAGHIDTTEVGFYSELAPSLTIATPRVFFAESRNETEFVLVMEDLAPAAQRDQLEGCSVADASLAMTQAAALHASSWDGSVLTRPWLHSAAAFWGQVGAGIPQLAAGFSERFGSEFDAICVELTAEVDRWLASLERPRCLWHGDFRLDNMLFDGARPLVVVDWQTVMPGPPAADVSYFLGNSLVPEQRRAEEERLVAGYHEALGIPGYGWAQCWSDYRAQSLHGLVLVLLASLGVERTERGDRMFLTMARRVAAQIEDLDAFAALPDRG